jgi:hypothetical protein
MVGTIFPADLLVNVAAFGMKPARGDQGVLAGEINLAHGMRVGAEVFARRLSRLLLVAPETGDPFATGDVTQGSGNAAGLSLDFSMSRARYGVLASYSWQRTRLRHGDTTYAPEHGVGHLAEAGVILFPSPTFSIRVGAALLAGRRGTLLSDRLEWESCNLLDMGCEFGGTPHYNVGTHGQARLPVYYRTDVGLRKHWHVHVGGRDVQLAAFGTLTNLFGRNNVLAVGRDATTGDRADVLMRPFAPLVLGIDWNY